MTMAAPYVADDVLTVRGEGGDEFTQTVPADGTQQRETFDGMIAKGLLVVVDTAEPERAPEREPERDASEPGVETHRPSTRKGH
jgi:hypothetical protein